MRLVRAPVPAVPVPPKLSDTNLFRNLVTLNPSTKLHAYSIRSPLWSDGAEKSRWVHVPVGVKASMAASGTTTLPAGTLLVKHFELPAGANPVGRTRRLETRVLVKGTDTTYGITYRWNAAGTDADLVTEAIHETITDAALPDRTWHFPSTGECWSCHRGAQAPPGTRTDSDNRVLGFRGEQMNFDLPGGANQLTALAAKNVFDGVSIGNAPAPLASPDDVAAPIEARASAYLAANCAPCHHPGAVYLGGTSWNALPGVAPNSRGLIGAPHHNFPMARELGMSNAPLVAKGNPAGSILMSRVSSTDRDLGMPPLGRSVVDPLGASVINAWIQSLP